MRGNSTGCIAHRKRVVGYVLVLLLLASYLSADEMTQYGICEHPTFTRDHALSARHFKLITDIGVAYVRTDFHWTGLSANGNPSQEFDFQTYDDALANAGKCGVSLLPILTAAPGYAKPIHEHLDLWGNYVRQVVERYCPEMHYWEVWNEPNLFPPEYWGEKKDSKANYTKALRTAYETIKKVDPELKVLYGGTAHIPLDYIEETFKEGAGKYFDIMNVHPYGTSNQPEDYIPQQFEALKKLMAAYGVGEKPIWATEIGWPTVLPAKPWIYKAILLKAFSEIDIDPSQSALGVINDVEQGFVVQSPAFDIIGNFPDFRTVREIKLGDLANLEPKDCPVLLAAREEIFPFAFFCDLVEYVRKGGTIILPEGIPFGYDRPTTQKGTNEKQTYLQNKHKALHIKVSGYWSMGIKGTSKISLPGYDIPTDEMKNERFLEEGYLEQGDKFVPLAFGLANEEKYPFAGVYKLNSSLKGNVIVIASRGYGTKEEVSRELQAEILPRAYLLMFAEGVEKVFWYKLSSSGTDADGDRERNFGIVDSDLNPKPAYKALETLIKLRPDGSTRPVIEIRDGVYHARWKMPDGRKILALWTVKGEKEITLGFTNNLAVTDFLGSSVPVQMKNGKIRIVASPKTLYIIN